MSHRFVLLLSLLSFTSTFARAQTYSATYLPSTAPKTTEQGQSGTNQCGTTASQSSMCQNAYINNVNDWCIWAPPTPGPGSAIGNTERIEVAWCLKDGYGTRLIPDGTIKGAHFVQTPDFVQITGIGDLTKINIPAGDQGGELDPHGADGNGNPIGGLVFSNAFGELKQVHEWTNFVSATEFCFRACTGKKAATWCQHIYDVMGCAWNMPGNYAPGVFENCEGDSGEPMGVYGTSTFHQGDPATPPPHPIPSSSKCQTLNTIGSGVQFTAPALAPSSPSSSAVPSSSGISSSASPSTVTPASTSLGASSTPSSSATGTKSSSSGPSQTPTGSHSTSGTGSAAAGGPSPTSSATTGSAAANAGVGHVGGSWKQIAYAVGLSVVGSIIGGAL